MKYVIILGRQPGLGRTELESLYGAAAIQKLGDQAVLLEAEQDIPVIDRLGGAMKLCNFITTSSDTDLHKIVQYLASFLPKQLQHVGPGKLNLGLSLYGFNISPSKINASALSLKKALKSGDRGVRIVPNKQPELNSAQVIHNQLTKQNGLEVVLIKTGKRTIIAHTIAVQDIDAYAARDQARPARDAKVGMLPPKLAQIIINISHPTSRQNPDPATILDPFCGTGVILQEALLLGHDAAGTDLDPRMVAYTQKNLAWLNDMYNLNPNTYSATVGDATSFRWTQQFDAIACEAYLGRPFSATPSPAQLQEVIRDVDTIVRKFLRNVAAQTKPGFRLCTALPAWKTPHGFKHLPILDHLTDLGYTRISFVHAANEELIYHRPNQVVARELVTLIRQ